MEQIANHPNQHLYQVSSQLPLPDNDFEPGVPSPMGQSDVAKFLLQEEEAIPTDSAKKALQEGIVSLM